MEWVLHRGVSTHFFIEYLSKIKEYLQKNHGGVYAKFLRRQTPLPSGKREKSPCSTTNFLYTRKMSSEAPQFKISGVWGHIFFCIDTFGIWICSFLLEFPGKWALSKNFFCIDPELSIPQQAACTLGAHTLVKQPFNGSMLKLLILPICEYWKYTEKKLSIFEKSVDSHMGLW